MIVNKGTKLEELNGIDNYILSNWIKLTSIYRASIIAYIERGYYNGIEDKITWIRKI